jgi:biotin carboxyl carrier protein
MRQFVARVAGREHEVSVAELADAPGQFVVTVDGVERRVDARALERGATSLLDHARSYVVEIEGKSPDFTVHLCGHAVALQLEDARRQRLEKTATRSHEQAGPVSLRSPMPGKVVKILVREGESIAAGAGVVVVEAMKMDNELRAPRAGKLARLLVAEGQAVESGEELAQIE